MLSETIEIIGWTLLHFVWQWIAAVVLLSALTQFWWVSKTRPTLRMNKPMLVAQLLRSWPTRRGGPASAHGHKLRPPRRSPLARPGSNASANSSNDISSGSSVSGCSEWRSCRCDCWSVG